MGDCSFPRNETVRAKYPIPICDIPENSVEAEHLNDIYDDIQDILIKNKMKDKIKQIVKPENGIETAIVNDAEFIEGLSYGKVRKGHPEGQVIYHIKEVLENIDKFYPEDDNRQDLRLIALVHDTFKYKVDQTKPKVGENHHGTIARIFAQKFTIDHRLLKIIEHHDEAYRIWGIGARRGNWYKAEKKINQLISDLRLVGCLDLYLKFYFCDNVTGDKTQESYEWFIKQIL